MKKTLAILLTVMLLVAVMPTAAFAAGAVANGKTTVYRVKTNGSNLNVRSGPGTDYDIITSIPNGTPFTLVKTTKSWYRIRTFWGVSGWVRRTWTAKNAYARVGTNYTGLNVRKGPGNGYRILGSAPKGARVTVKYINGSWAYVTYGRLSGWSWRSYLVF